MKLILSNNVEIEVIDGSTLFDVQIDQSQYQNVWSQFIPENMKLVKLVSDDGEDLYEQKENLIVDIEYSIRRKNKVQCHFYLREKKREELLEEKVTMLETQIGIHDSSISDFDEVIDVFTEE